MDGDAVRKSESALRKEVAALKAKLESVLQTEATQLATIPSSGEADQAGTSDQAGAATKTRETALKELAADESLSEEARDSAMKALEALVASQLSEIEQTAAVQKLESEHHVALKKRTTELVDMESEQAAALRKLELEAQFEQRTVEAQRQKAFSALELKTDGDTELEDEMAEWLRRHRLQRYTASFTRIAGWCASSLNALPLPACARD